MKAWMINPILALQISVGTRILSLGIHEHCKYVIVIYSPLVKLSSTINLSLEDIKLSSTINLSLFFSTSVLCACMHIWVNMRIWNSKNRTGKAPYMCSAQHHESQISSLPFSKYCTPFDFSIDSHVKI